MNRNAGPFWGLLAVGAAAAVGAATHDAGFTAITFIGRFEERFADWHRQAHGGTVALESEAGRGTTVRVRLPGSPGGTDAVEF